MELIAAVLAGTGARCVYVRVHIVRYVCLGVTVWVCPYCVCVLVRMCVHMQARVWRGVCVAGL